MNDTVDPCESTGVQTFQVGPNKITLSWDGAIPSGGARTSNGSVTLASHVLVWKFRKSGLFDATQEIEAFLEVATLSGAHHSRAVVADVAMDDNTGDWTLQQGQGMAALKPFLTAFGQCSKGQQAVEAKGDEATSIASTPSDVIALLSKWTADAGAQAQSATDGITGLRDAFKLATDGGKVTMS